LLLIVFLENAFKYVQPNAQGERFLTVAVRLEADRHLDFHVRNTHQPLTGPAEQGGVGLNNVRRRLELLYPGRHSLVLSDAGGIFAAHLQIDLQP
jgi:two-component system, LytTR family, sensor kinase